MKIEWNTQKAQINLKKHGVSFEMAMTVFSDPMHLSVLDFSSQDENRWITIGHASDQKTLIVVHLYFEFSEEDVIRIISARKATKKEKREYEEGI